MIKLDLAPAGFLMAFITFLALSTLMRVIVFVAFYTGRFYFNLVGIFLVTVLALEIFVATPNGKFRVLVMIKR